MVRLSGTFFGTYMHVQPVSNMGFELFLVTETDFIKAVEFALLFAFSELRKESQEVRSLCELSSSFKLSFSFSSHLICQRKKRNETGTKTSPTNTPGSK